MNYFPLHLGEGLRVRAESGGLTSACQRGANGGRRDQNFVKPVGNDESPPEVAGRIGGATICLGFENPNDRLDHAPSPSQLGA